MMISDRAKFAWLGVTGVGFWFAVGFPFGNHNESYYWLAAFRQMTGWEVWTTALAATFRPLGQGLAHLGWQLAGESSWPIQLFNFIVAALSLWFMALAIGETRTFALTAAVAGGGYFAGFVYLFHLHGVFYSPVLAFIAAALYLNEASTLTTTQRESALFGCGVAIGLLFHPYALILFLGYLAGRIIEVPTSAWGTARRGLLALLAGGMLAASRPEGHQVLSTNNFRGFLTSYALTELSIALSLLSALLAVATVLSIEHLRPGMKLSVMIVTLLSAVGVGAAGLPVIFVWITAAILKMAYLRKWSLAAMTAAAAGLPAIAPSGSPTYAVFAVFLAAIALAWRWTIAERLIAPLRPVCVQLLLLAAVLLALMLRLGIEFPIASRLAAPLLAEREKTTQLEQIAHWILNSEYRSRRLTLDTARNPVDAGVEAIHRKNRPPTYQHYLDAYLESHGSSPSDNRPLLVTFGDSPRHGKTPLKTVSGRFAGAARVFE